SDIPYKNGELLDELLQMAKDNKMDYLQLITWNDFGEGTMIEPTVEFQYKFLESVQHFTGVDYGKPNLEAIYTYYKLKKQVTQGYTQQKQLTQVFYYLISLQDEKAIDLMAKINK